MGVLLKLFSLKDKKLASEIISKIKDYDLKLIPIETSVGYFAIKTDPIEKEIEFPMKYQKF